MKSIIVRLPDEVHAKLRQIAFDRMVSINSLINQAVNDKIGSQK